MTTSPWTNFAAWAAEAGYPSQYAAPPQQAGADSQTLAQYARTAKLPKANRATHNFLRGVVLGSRMRPLRLAYVRDVEANAGKQGAADLIGGYIAGVANGMIRGAQVPDFWDGYEAALLGYAVQLDDNRDWPAFVRGYEAGGRVPGAALRQKAEAAKAVDAFVGMLNSGALSVPAAPSAPAYGPQPVPPAQSVAQRPVYVAPPTVVPFEAIRQAQTPVPAAAPAPTGGKVLVGLLVAGIAAYVALR